MKLDEDQLFAQLPSSLRDSLLKEYRKVVKNYQENRWEPAELDGAKFAEVVYWVVKGHLEGTYPTSLNRISRFDQLCTQLANIPTTITYDKDSIRLTLPRLLIALYDIRNHRSVGHAYGDVDPNYMDATVVIHMAKWIMAELIRILHKTDVRVANQAVETLTERTLPYVWEVDGIKRVLQDNKNKQKQVLHLLYATTKPVSVKEMATWTETRSDNLKRVLRRMHNENLLHLNVNTGEITISPVGIRVIEQNFLNEQPL